LIRCHPNANHKKDSAPFRNLLTSILLIVFLFFPSENSPLFAQSITQQDQTTLPPSDFNPCIRILSIDGGGVRGIIPAAVLERIEEETGEPVSRLFDFISGTSTGAVISLALTKPSEKNSQRAQFSAKDIVGFYERDSRILFPPPSTETEEKRFLTSTKYSPEPPLNIFRQTFGKTGLEKSLVPILVPTYNIKDKKPFFFKSWIKSTNDYPMSEVARAAVAAPGYFPPVELTAHRKTSSKKQTLLLVDGGVFANNPMRYALENSYQLGDIRKGIFLLSLGTGKTSPEHPGESPYHWEEAKWTTPLKNLLFADPPGQSADPSMTNQPSSSQVTLRMEPVIPAENAAMDNAGEQNLLTLKNISKQMMNQNRPAFKRILRILRTPRPAGCFREGNLPD
jgi:predicted acylesterase/phospholipase RssA